ncbi:tetratricopeptide repeat protein [Wolbachia endosymbiont (group A) of Melieria omissa]|uniref:tetratricopeptide repeat protein n=1 Tax=Wolbachia endosymbiont (group A) of Melieria omissa TaxID=3139311 RepID=UPI003CCAF8E8
MVQAKHRNDPSSSANITFEDLFIDGNNRKRQKEDFGLNKYFESHPEIKQNPEYKNSDITLVIHANVNVNLKKGTEKQGKVETLEEYLEESKLTDDNILSIYEGHRGTCYKIKNHIELKKYFSCGSEDEIEDFLLRIRFVVNQPNHSKLDDIIKKEIGSIYKISGKKNIDMVFDFARGKVEKWWEQQGSEVSYLTRKDNYFKEAIEHLYSLKLKEDLPEFWQVPLRNYNFVGREALLDKIEECLKANDTATLVAYHGIGGIGKTQLALEFIWSKLQKYRWIIWLDTRDRNTLINEYIKLGRGLNVIHGYRENVREEDHAKHVKYWLEHPERAGWLLICDNAPNYKDIADLLPIEGGKILLTSRYTFGWPQPQNTISVDVFEPGESRSYICKILEVEGTKLDIIQVDALAKTLGHLPLALAQASAYIKKTGINISDYLKLYNDRKRALLSDETLLETFPADANRETAAIVYVTWDITVEAIKKESLLAANWLTACAYLDGSPIPQSLLEIFADNQENNPSLETFHEAFGILISYSMLTTKKDHSMLIHSLVQEVIRLKSEKSGKTKEDIKTVFQLLQKGFPYHSDKLEDYAKKRQLLPHLEAFLSHMDNLLEKNSSEKQTIEKDYLLDLLMWINDGYSDLGNPKRQKELIEWILPILQRHFIPDYEIATLLVSLGIAYNALDNPRNAKELFEWALPILEKYYGSDCPKVAVALTNLGNAYEDSGNPHKAKKLFEWALPIFEKHYGSDHPKVAVILTNLGHAYENLDNPRRAKKLFEQALAIQEKHYGLDHFEVAKLRANLGLVCYALGDLQKAKELSERALPIFEKHYGPDHLEFAKLLSNLGVIYGGLGYHKKRKRLLERALAIKRKHYRSDHFEVAILLVNLGIAHNALGSSQKARELLERALPIFEKHYGPDHPEVAKLLVTLGITYGILGKHKKNQELLKRALPVFKKHYGPDHPEIAIILISLGISHGDLGDHEKQKELFEQALPILEKHYGPDHPEVATLLINLSDAYGALGNHKKQKELFARASSIFKKHYGPDHPEVAKLLAELDDI